MKINCRFAPQLWLRWLVIAGASAMSMGSGAQTVPSFGNFGGPATQKPPAPLRVAQPSGKVNWFPIQAKFAPDGSWVIVNLCSVHSPNYCRLVRWEPGGTPQPLPGVVGHWNSPVGRPSMWVPDRPSDSTHDSQSTTGRWRLISGQDPDKSYLWPVISWDGKKLAYVVADCEARSAPGRPGTPYDCSITNAKLSISDSIETIASHRILPVITATRPTFRPDDQALIYWRVLGTGVLASGRATGAKSVYEYDLKANVETPKMDYEVTRVLWQFEFTAPFYSDDGKTFSTCGYGSDNARLFMEAQRLMCVEVDAAKVGAMRALNDRKWHEMNGAAAKPHWQYTYVDWRNATTQAMLGGGAFALLHTGWRDGKAVVSGDTWTYVLDRGTRNFETPANAGVKYNWGLPSDADIHPRNGDIVRISGTYANRLQPAPSLVYWSYRAQIGTSKPFPIFAYLVRNSGTATAVYWPDIEQLQ